MGAGVGDEGGGGRPEIGQLTTEERDNLGQFTSSNRYLVAVSI